MTEAETIKTETLPVSQSEFSTEQKEYLTGFMAGVAQRGLFPYVGATGGGLITGDPSQGGANRAAEETIHGFPLEDVTKQELWKHEENPLDSWERILAHEEENKAPDAEDNFRLRYFGLFHVAPTEDSFMLRCRIPAGDLTATQFKGLAEIADDYGNGKAAVTTRSNIQIREIAPKNVVHVLTRLQGLGLTAKGSGADNVRNVTASPTAGFDRQELIDTRPFAHAMHHYILNHRDLYGLPRKFNIAFEGGGAVDTVADSNDIGFMAVAIRPRSSSSSSSSKQDGNESSTRTTDEDEHDVKATSLQDGSAVALDPGVYFRVELCGISGHKQLASDCGILIKPNEAVAVAAAMLRVFVENGDRTDRKKARLKYLVDKWGVEEFLEETQKKLAFPLLKLPIEQCKRRPAPIKHGHIGVYRQKEKGKNYIGAVIPVGIMSTRQMRRIATLAENYGSSDIRLTPWQNLLLPDIPDGFVETVKRQLVRMGFHHEATSILGGLVACTGNQGCKYAAADTKGHAIKLGEYLNKRFKLDHPINIHLTGCPHSCAQHYIGDIGLQGVTVNVNGESVEGYNVVFGGGYGAEAGIGQQVFTGISFSELPQLLEKVFGVYQSTSDRNETFVEFTRRHDVKQLQEMFS